MELQDELPMKVPSDHPLNTLCNHTLRALQLVQLSGSYGAATEYSAGKRLDFHGSSRIKGADVIPEQNVKQLMPESPMQELVTHARQAAFSLRRAEKRRN